MHIDMRPIMFVITVFDSVLLIGLILAYKRSNRVFKLFFFALAVIAIVLLTLLVSYFIRLLFFPSPLL